jgi:Spy/CpxP family protein refolding chaperone
MKISMRSPHLLHFRQLLGLALIGFVLWLAVIGWLWIKPAKVVPAELHHGNPETRRAGLQTQLNLTSEQIDRIRPILEEQAAKRQRLREKYRGRDRRAMWAEKQASREEHR